MGDIADMMIEDGLMFEDEFERPVQCKYCKREEFYWRNLGTEEKPIWRLVTAKTGKIHSCKKYGQ